MEAAAQAVAQLVTQDALRAELLEQGVVGAVLAVTRKSDASEAVLAAVLKLSVIVDVQGKLAAAVPALVSEVACKHKFLQFLDILLIVSIYMQTMSYCCGGGIGRQPAGTATR